MNPVSLKPNQLRRINELVDLRQRNIEHTLQKSFDSEVKKIEKMLDEGYEIQYLKKK